MSSSYTPDALGKKGRGSEESTAGIDETCDDRANQSIDPAERNRLLQKKVIYAEKWERSLAGSGKNLRAFGAVHQGVVVKLEGESGLYLVHKLAQDNLVVAKREWMGSKWRKISSTNCAE